MLYPTNNIITKKRCSESYFYNAELYSYIIIYWTICQIYSDPDLYSNCWKLRQGNSDMRNGADPQMTWLLEKLTLKLDLSITAIISPHIKHPDFSKCYRFLWPNFDQSQINGFWNFLSKSYCLSLVKVDDGSGFWWEQTTWNPTQYEDRLSKCSSQTVSTLPAKNK